MNRIVIVGSSGSGKTTFSKRLAAKLNLPLYHLDSIFWNGDHTHISAQEFDEKLEEILQKESWILDGDYSRTYRPRFEAADTIIFLDYPLDVCLDGVKSRIGTKRSDMPWVETHMDEEFRDWIIGWHKNTLPVLRELLESYRNKKRIITFTARDEASAFLATCGSVSEAERKNDIVFRKALQTDKDSVSQLYQAVKGTEYCTWNDVYPGEFELETDLSAQNLFVLEKSGEIIGAISIVSPNEMDELPYWKSKEQAGEFARVVIKPEDQRKGLAQILVKGILHEFRRRGIVSVHISVAKTNLPAVNLYRKNGFDFVGECMMYGINFWLCELRLKAEENA